MTCIVGLKDKDGNIYIGGDSCASDPVGMQTRSDVKVFKIEGYGQVAIIGFCSSFRMGQVLRYKLKLPKRKKNENIYEWMCTKFIEAVKKVLNHEGLLTVDDEGVDSFAGPFLVAYEERLFKIDTDFQVAEHRRPYDAAGVGESYAYASLYTTDEHIIEGINPITRIIIALKAATEFSPYVRPPYIIGVLKDRKYYEEIFFEEEK
jgi:ATP-dependent protease HslVU (ClpYQ) peptidase subunit